MTNYNDLSVKGLVESAKSTYGDTPQAALAATQAILESGLYNNNPSRLAREGYNLFGIKGDGDDGTIELPTNEELNGEMVRVNAPFAKYKNYESSFNAHKTLMKKERYKDVWGAETPYDAFDSVYNAGYATDSKYPKLLRNVFDQYVKQYFE